MKEETMISLADFSKYPSGRDDRDGSYNGERYRKEVLVPQLKQAEENGNQVVCVSLNGVLSFGSSFLEEAFGGLVRKENFSKEKLKEILRIDAGKPSFARHERAIWVYIQDAT